MSESNLPVLVSMEANRVAGLDVAIERLGELDGEHAIALSNAIQAAVTLEAANIERQGVLEAANIERQGVLEAADKAAEAAENAARTHYRARVVAVVIGTFLAALFALIGFILAAKQDVDWPFSSDEESENAASSTVLPVGPSENPSIDQVEGLVLEVVRPTRVAASTTEPPFQLKTGEWVNHDALLMVDSDRTTAWNSDGDVAEERGQWVEFHFSETIRLSEIRIWSGFQRTMGSYDQFTRNSRPQQVVLLSGVDEFRLELDDTRGAQRFSVNSQAPTKLVRLEIVVAYRGSAFNDVAISEIEFVAQTAAQWALL